MAPVRPFAGARSGDRFHLARAVIPALVVLLFVLEGLPTAGTPHAAIPLASMSSPASELLAQARATPVPAAAPTTAAPHPAAAAGPVWTNLTSKLTNQVPAYRYIGTMQYDPVDHYVLLFGGMGNGSTSPYSDTWAYANGHWTQLDVSGPPARYAAMMTWDAGDGYMLLYGGIDESTTPTYTLFNDTWTFVHGAWTQIFPSSVPPARWRGAMAYDAADNYTVLFGGTPSELTDSPMKDTWTYKAGVWTNVTTKVTGSPAARYRQDMTYDAADGYLVMFGGCTTSDVVSTADTLTYHNYTWTLLNPSTKPPGRTYTGLTYDASQGYVLMFGGVNEATSTGLDDTWAFHNGTWTDLTSDFTTQPSTRGLEMLAYDPLDGYDLLFGGQNPSNDLYHNDSWAFGPSVIGRLAVSPDTVDLHQSISINATPFAYDGYANYTYTLLPPGCTNANVSVLTCTPSETGVFNVSVSVNDSNGLPSTKNATVTVNPDLVVTGITATPSTVTIGSGLYVNVTYVNGTAPYAFSYTGLPSGCHTLSTASLSCTPTASGDFTVTATVRDAVGWNESTMVSITVNPKPSIMSLVASPATIDLGGHFTLWANATGGTAPLAWTYLGLPMGCSTSDASMILCTPTATGTFGLIANVSDVFGNVATATTTVTVNTAPSILAFVVSPGSVDLGLSVSFWLNSTGGTGVLTDNYAQLPPGCSFGHLAHASCTPTSNGTFTVTGSVTDVLGTVVSTTVTLTIVPDPTVNTVTVSPLRVDVGQPVTISVAVSGGTTPYAYEYSGLPTGCANTTTAVVTCHPVAQGTFNFVAEVTDAWRYSAQLGAQLTVNEAPAITQFTATISPVTIGSTTVLVTTVTGGSGIYTFVYTNLPAGCTSANRSSLSCTPTQTGSFNVTVMVTDSFGRTASSTTQFVVQPAPSSAGFLGLSGSTGYLLIGLIVVLLVVVVVLALTRRRRPPAENPPPAEEWQEDPPES
jgi:hypothetical protein